MSNSLGSVDGAIVGKLSASKDDDGADVKVFSRIWFLGNELATAAKTRALEARERMRNATVTTVAVGFTEKRYLTIAMTRC